MKHEFWIVHVEKQNKLTIFILRNALERDSKERCVAVIVPHQQLCATRDIYTSPVEYIWSKQQKREKKKKNA